MKTQRKRSVRFRVQEAKAKGYSRDAVLQRLIYLSTEHATKNDWPCALLAMVIAQDNRIVDRVYGKAS